MIYDTLEKAITENYPMLLIFTVVIVSIRTVYLIVNKEKFVFYKELISFAFLLYSLLLFYVVTFQDINYGTNNYVPFKEIFRYEFGSKVFIHNIIGNIILFIPFGFFVSTISTDVTNSFLMSPLPISNLTCCTPTVSVSTSSV